MEINIKFQYFQKILYNLYAVTEVPLAKIIAGFNPENMSEHLDQKVVDAGFDTLQKIKKGITTYQSLF